MLNISFVLLFDSISCSTFSVHTYILTPGLREMNTHNDFLDNAVNDELEMECIGDLTTDVCSDMQNDTEKMCLSLQNATC